MTFNHYNIGSNPISRKFSFFLFFDYKNICNITKNYMINIDRYLDVGGNKRG